MSMIKFRNPGYREGGTEPKWIELPVYSDEYPGTMKYQGEVSTYESLPSDAQWGDVYELLDTGNKCVFNQNNEWTIIELNTVEIGKLPQSNGVYIYDINTKFTLPSQWNTENNDKAVGVAIVSDNCRFVVAKQDIGQKSWGTGGYDVPEVASTTNSTTAANDFNGVTNTTKITNISNNETYAANSCLLNIFYNDKVGYLGSAGEWKIARSYKDELNSALELIGGNKMTEGYYWTSTEYDPDTAWLQRFDSYDSLAKDRKTKTAYYVRAFLDINPKEITLKQIADSFTPDAPRDNKTYARKNGQWVAIADITEVVQVNISTNGSDTSILNGVTVTATPSDGSSPIEQVYVGKSLEFALPGGVEYVMSFSSIDGYSTPDSQTFTAIRGRTRIINVSYNSEFLTVNVGVDNGTLGAYTISVSGIGSQTSLTKTYKIPYGTQYTISGSAVDGFTTPASQTFTAGVPSRTVNMTYFQIVNGLYIYDTDDRLVPVASWNTANNSKAVGVAILTDDCRFVVAKEDIGQKMWGGYGTDVPGVLTTTDSAVAATDFDGVNNTSKIIAAIGNTNEGYRDGTAAGDCAAYVFPNGKTGYLGAAGEWQVARQNKEDLNSALTLIGGTTMKESAYWTSTESSSSGAWGQHFDSDSTLYTVTKYSSNRYVRAFLAI